MNKNDMKLITIILIFSILILGVYKLNNKSASSALVYYEDELILKIDLSKEEKTYEVKGDNGIVYIKAGNGRVKVDEEISPRNLCSKQGYIKEPYESIVCLPNKIIIKIDANKDEIDTIIR